MERFRGQNCQAQWQTLVTPSLLLLTQFIFNTRHLGRVFVTSEQQSEQTKRSKHRRVFISSIQKNEHREKSKNLLDYTYVPQFNTGWYCEFDIDMVIDARRQGSSFNQSYAP
eukprot:13673023-Ditylum_brightwellii.AAC.1